MNDLSTSHLSSDGEFSFFFSIFAINTIRESIVYTIIGSVSLVAYTLIYFSLSQKHITVSIEEKLKEATGLEHLPPD